MIKLQTYSKILRWLLAQSKYYWVQMLLNVVLGVGYVIATLSFVWVTKRTVDIATGASSENLNMAIVMLVLIMMIEIAMGFCSRWVRAVLGIKARNKLQEQTFNRLLTCDWQSVKRYHTGDVLNRVMEDVVVVVNLLTEDLPSLLTTIFQLGGAFAFMFVMDRRLAVVVLCIAPIFALFSKLYIKKLRKLTHEVRKLDSTVQSCIQESLQHSLVVKTLEKISYVTGRLVANHVQLQRKVVEKTWYSTLSQLVMNIGFALGYLVTFVWGVKSLYAGVITYGALTAFVQLVGQIQHPIRTLTRFIPIFISAFTASERLIELEEIPLEDDGCQHAHGDLQNTNPHLAIKDVSYRYDEHSPYILRNFNFDFPVGSITAIVGETGAGKTTLIRLMLALVKPTDGFVQIDGQDVTAKTRSLFSYVPQGNTLLSGTLRENLLMGCPEASDEKLWEVLHVAGADFVKRMQEGLETRFGEMGSGLSEGQAQRVCIARALLRRSPIMLFDESTSALDETTEKIVVDRIIKYMNGATLIFVTHRPAIISYCTQTLCLNRLSERS